MSDTVISIRGIGKKYKVGHQSARQERYTALRDVIVREGRAFFRKASDLIHGREIVQGDEVEDFWALKDVDFDVLRGEVVGIIGRNGAGKSTLLKILSRITEPTEGRIEIRGRVASLLEVGTGFHPELTGRENIFLNGAVLGMSRAEIRTKFDDIVAFAEVERFLDTPVKRYSSGMFVRLAFAVAAHLEPEILVVDEVLAVGDAEFQKKCLGKMSQVAKGGRTVLFVSHNQAAVRSLCSHGVVMRGGRCSPKMDVAAALQDYTADRSTALGLTWTRPPALPTGTVYFDSISAELGGEQPHMTLTCALRLRAEPGGRAVFLAVDFHDRNLGAVMQAVPYQTPFVGGTPGSYEVALTVDLPPLVPGHYTLDFWIGPHNTETSDYVREAITIEITNSPSPGRSFPHSPDHGFIVASSRASVQTGTAASPGRAVE